MTVRKILSIVSNDTIVSIINKEGICMEYTSADNIVRCLDYEVNLVSFYEDSITIWVTIKGEKNHERYIDVMA